MARLERDVARALRHISESGGDLGALDGNVVLSIEDGKLTGVRFDDGGAPDVDDVPVKRGKRVKS